MTGESSWLGRKKKSVADRVQVLLVAPINAESRACDFAQAHARGMLTTYHPLDVCKAYAGLEILPWGRFTPLDKLRSLILNLPEPANLLGYDIGLSKGDQAVLVYPYPGATRTVIVFTDIARHMGAPLRLVHPWLWRFGVNVIYVSDQHFNYFLGPIDGLGATAEDKVARIKQLLRDLGSQVVFCLGNSGGGFGALFFAPLLGAERVLAYSSPTVIRESLPDVLRRAPDLDPRLWESGEINLVTHWRRQAKLPKVRIYYGGLNKHDRQEAENMAVIATVELCAIADSAEHSLQPMLIPDGRFAQHLEWLMAR
jgi:hypothetical protein